VDKLYAKEIELLIQHTIEQMPPQRKEIIKMSRYKGLSNAEISETLNLSVRTVERHIYLALKELKKALS
jgi:RNA polymerase sigma-70 factor (ECF subfamily)